MHRTSRRAPIRREFSDRPAAAAILLAAGLALTGCSNSSSRTKPKATPSATSSAPASTSAADAISARTDAIVAGKGQDAPECSKLSPDDLFKSVQAANKKGRDALRSAIASASPAAQ
ncbi:hypothetical protein ACWET9_31425 [Streptomyces sp. NPDC004059]